MLQGNSFEAELVMRDRTRQVQQEIRRDGSPLMPQHVVRVQQWWRAVLSGVRLRDFNPRNVPLTIQDYKHPT